MNSYGTILVFTLTVPLSVPAAAAAPRVDYVRQVKPILSRHCTGCHGGLRQRGGLRLDTGALARTGGESGPAVRARRPEQSPLIERVRSTDPEVRMPLDAESLSAEQIAVLVNWIRQGAVSPGDEQAEPDPKDHWAFRVPKRPDLPTGTRQDWQSNPIDALVAARHEAAGVVPSRAAEPHRLLRRLYLDLVGLPPSPEVLNEFLADPSDEAYRRIVDRLLASPRHGERWARHWMDVWRYSDWYGRRAVNDVRNSYPHIWRWRDWIIDSLNHDHGYDRMLREMLAADELAPGDDRAIAATGFIVRNWFSLNYDQWLKDQVEHTGKAFLALRLNCAHCHNHKYDPIRQKEYFAFRAFFEPLEFRHDRVPGGPALTRYKRYKPGSGASLKPITAGLPRIFDENLDAETYVYEGGDARQRIKGRPPVPPAAPAFLAGDRLTIHRVKLPPVAWNPSLRPFVIAEETSRRRRSIAAATDVLVKAREAGTTDLKPLKLAVAEARKRLAAVEAAVRREAGRAKKAAGQVPADRRLGWWRFEGADDPRGFLADSSGRGHQLVRVTRSASPARLHRLSGKGPGGRFPSPSPPDGRDNRQAAGFAQVSKPGYLATPVDKSLYARTFTAEVYLHIAVAKPGFNCGIVDCDGSWDWLHRGLDKSTSELRLILVDREGNRRDVASGRALVLKTGVDYYLALLVGEKQVRVFARELGKDSPLVEWRTGRAADGKPVVPLSLPREGGTLKIGNSGNGTGRHQGLIDEVAYTAGVLSREQLLAHSASGPWQEKLSLARQALATAESKLKQSPAAVRSAEATLSAGRAELEAYQARLAAERARAGDDDRLAGELATQAAKAERTAALLAARSAVGSAEAQLADGVDDKARKALAAARQQLVKAQARQNETSAKYTPLGPTYPRHSSGRRTALAHWITSPDNPLTARVAVNHIWLRHFGRPLVESVFDFGRSGREPTHPRLLDWLAVELVERGWSMKAMHRLIVTSRAYRMASDDAGAFAANRQHDGDNVLWWRFETRRAEAEVIHDSLLVVSGGLDDTLGGPELDNRLEVSGRRGLYFAQYPEAGGTMRFLSLFDAADPNDCYRRNGTIVPQQALALSNSRLALNRGRLLARRLWQSVRDDVVAEDQRARVFVRRAFERILTRQPTDDECNACLQFMENQVELFGTTDGKRLAAGAAKGEVAPATDPVPRSREGLVRVLFNHSEFVTIP